MATRTDRTLRRQLQTLFNVGVIQELTDGQLLERFATHSGEMAELAFAALVERHGSMVLRVCRAQLRDAHDSQDAFQATFMILIRRARTLWVHDSLGPWLHQVAFRTACCARSSIARRRRLEQRVVEPERNESRTEIDLEPLLHEEINRLPDRYRIPIVLCDLEGLSCEEAARRMGRPVGTVKSWRSRARDRLRNRMIGRGVAPSVGLSMVISANVAVGESVRVLADSLMAGTVPASVVSLVNGVTKAMLIGKIRMAAAAVVGVFALATGIGVALAQDAKKPDSPLRSLSIPEKDRAIPAVLKEKGEVWEMSLPEAIRLGLRNSKTVRVIEATTPNDPTFRIGQVDRKMSPHVFASEVMAHVRSVEQQYWALNLMLVEYWAAETAVNLGQEILKREEAKYLGGVGVLPNVAEASEQLERFKMNLVDKTSELITTERQLRHILGLNAHDGRRIVPTTKPREDEIKPEWEASKEAMFRHQPDILKSKSLLESLDLKSADPMVVERQKDFNQQVIDQTEHSLARFLMEVDSNYKLFQTAGRLKASAKQRLDAQAAFFENGTVTIDRYLDAVNRWSTSVAQEAKFRAQYNTAIAALEEVKGTLLTHDQIAIIDEPKVAEAKPKDTAVQPASLNLQPQPKPVAPKDEPSKKPDASGKTYSFQLKFGGGPKPLELSGSFTVEPSRPAATPTTRGN